VGSLPWSVNDEELKETFEKHGTVVSAKVITDRDTRRSRGFGLQTATPEDPEVLDLLRWRVLQMQAML
jgi:hypothetical protein